MAKSECGGCRCDVAISIFYSSAMQIEGRDFVVMHLARYMFPSCDELLSYFVADPSIMSLQVCTNCSFGFSSED